MCRGNDVLCDDLIDYYGCDVLIDVDVLGECGLLWRLLFIARILAASLHLR